ncbi:MAG: hypothetical protein ABJF50_15790 [Paracoccaceae bacterium]
MMKRELALISVVSKNWIFLVVAGVLGALAGHFIASQTEDSFEANAEIFVKFGNEYTVPSALSDNDRLQVDVDHPVALNAEIQILTSWPVIAATLERLPHPTDGTSVEQALEKLSVFNVANSPVLGLRIVDGNGQWSVNFLEELIASYLERRSALFKRSETRASLEIQRTQLSEELAELRTRIQLLERETAKPELGQLSEPSNANSAESALLALRESTVADMLSAIDAQEQKLDFFEATGNGIDVLSAPRLSEDKVGLGRTELMIITMLIFLMLAASIILLREIAGRERVETE